MPITNTFTIDLLSMAITILVIIICYLKWTFSYWEKRGVKTQPPSLPFGNVGRYFRKQYSIGEFFEEQYNYFKKQNLPYGGIYIVARKYFLPIDPILIKHILRIDFQHFTNNTLYCNEKLDPITGNLLALKDEKWKHLREKLTPTFTSGKMKMMFPTLVACGMELNKIVEKYANKKQEWDIQETLACFTTDIIASCAFGIETNCLQHPDSEFRKYGKMIFATNMKVFIKTILQLIFPHYILNLMPLKTTEKCVEDFFFNLVNKTVKYREENHIFRKDFMHLLIQLKNIGKITDNECIKDGQINENDGLTMNEVAAQAFVFFAAGFETSSTTITFALYELALNLDIQTKLREEIRFILNKYNGEITYEGIMEMKYLERVVCETLRKYPPAPAISRICNKDYKVPNSDLIIKKGNCIIIPIIGLHHDPEYYPNPEKFSPNRFIEENKIKRPPFTWLPFGEGPRMCIGSRFALIETKIGIITLIKDYNLTLNSNKTKIPIQFNKLSFITRSQDKIYLNVEKIL